MATEESSGPALVLTATVDPRGMRLTARSDPRVRLDDYLGSLRQWLVTPAFPRIVFCENSGYDLSELKALAASSSKKVEFLSFVAPEFPQANGKGYGEMLILQHVLDNSKVLQATDQVFKVTGRLYLQNAARLERLLMSEPNTDIFCDLRSKLDYTESRAFCGSVEFFRKYFLPYADDMDEDAEPMMNFERVLARAIHRAMADGLTWSLMPTTPQYVGYSGTVGNKYRVGPKWFATEVARRTRQILQRKLY